MAKTYKPRKLKYYDQELDAQLDIEELAATGGDSHHIFAMCHDTSTPVCPRCGGPVENHGKFKRLYIDVTTDEDGNHQIVELDYLFYKYRCLDDECPTVFQKEIDFARENAHLTRRMENYIIELACYMSYSGVSDTVLSIVTKQTVGQIIKRWVAEKDDERGFFYTPRILGLVSFELDTSNYILAVDAEGEKQNIIEVIPEVDSSLITAFIRKLDALHIEYVLTDCNPTIVDTVKSILPKAEVLVDTEALLADVLMEFDDLIKKDAKHTPNNVKKFIKEDPSKYQATGDVDTDRNIYEIREIRDALKNKPRLSDAYDHVNRLRGILSQEWDATDIHQWANSIPPSCEGVFAISVGDVEEYWNELLRYYMRRTEISGDLYQHLQQLNDQIKKLKRYSDEILRTRILYLPELLNMMDTSDKWIGVPLETAIAVMKCVINQTEEWKYERKSY